MLALQGAAVVIISALFLLKGTVEAYSALLGGLICWVPSAYFAIRAFRHQGARAAKEIVSTFYKAEAVKIALTGFLFFGAFYFVQPLSPLSLFMAFIGTQAVSWFSGLLLTHNPQRFS